MGSSADTKQSSRQKTRLVGKDLSAKRSKRLQRDLDNIVLMALRKEPQRRYASAEQFAEDVRRHLESLPVLARNDTSAYRFTKFVARHKAGVVGAALVAIALSVGMLIALHEARIARAERVRAEHRFNDVRNLSNTLLFQINDSIQDVPGTTQARKLLISSAQRYLDSLSQEASTDLSLLRELATGYQRLGQIQGGTVVPILATQVRPSRVIARPWYYGQSLPRPNHSTRDSAPVPYTGRS